MSKCNIENCEKPAKCRGMCATHYSRWYRHADPLVNKTDKGGISKHRLYSAWSGMRNRCENPNNSRYAQYGGRGIVVTFRWQEFSNFLADMGERPDGMTLDRIDPNGPYAPWNCRWATVIEQRANWSKEGQERQRKATSEAATRRWDTYRSGAISVPEPK